MNKRNLQEIFEHYIDCFRVMALTLGSVCSRIRRVINRDLAKNGQVS